MESYFFYRRTRIIPSKYTTGSKNINKTNVRYWSFNLGNAATYNFNALENEDANLDEEGYVNIVLASKEAEVPPIKEGMTDFTPLDSQKVMGDYAPQGVRMSKDEFLTENSLQAERIEVD